MTKWDLPQVREAGPAFKIQLNTSHQQAKENASIFISISAEKAFGKIPIFIHDKNPQ